MRRLVRIVAGAVRIFMENHCFERAAAISFFAFFSLIPILFLIISALGFILGARSDILEKVIEMARTTIPYLSGPIIEDLYGLVRGWKTLGWFSIGALILSAELVLNVVADALTHIFDVKRMYGFFRKRVLNLLVLSMAVLAAFVSILFTAAVDILTRHDITIFGVNLTRYIIGSLLMKYILPFVIIVLAVTVLYRIFSGANLRFRYALYGGVIFALIWEAAKRFFALYIYYFPTYNRFYGSLGTIMVLLIWMFFSAVILLFSAAVARAAFQERRLKRIGEGPGVAARAVKKAG